MLSLETTQKIAEEFLEEYNGNIPIKLIIKERQEDLYGQKYSRENYGYRIDGGYHPARSEVVLFAASFHDDRHVKESLRHELGGHWALNTLEPIEKRILLDRIVASHDEPSLRPLWQHVDNIYPEKSSLYKAEEVFAFVAEKESTILARTLSTEPDVLSAEPLNMFELRTIAESIDNGIRAGIRKQKIFPSSDLVQFRVSDNPTPTRTTRAQQDVIDQQKYAKAVETAQRVLREASPALANHPYLMRKKLHSDVSTWNEKSVLNLYEINVTHLKSIIGYTPKVGDNYLSGRILVAPIGDTNGLTSLEFIDSKGLKSALAGGRKSGAYYEPDFVNHKAREIYIAEGVATAMSIREVLKDKHGVYVVAALSCTNLKKAALDLKATFDDVPITICADIGNGYKDAKEAAAAVNGYLAEPYFHPLQRMPDGNVPTDFNDLWQLRPYSVSIDLNNRKLIKDLKVEDAKRIEDLGGDGLQGNKDKSPHSLNVNDRSNKMTTNAQAAESNAAPAKSNVPESIKLNASLIYGQGTQVYPAKAGGVYKGDMVILDNHVLQEIGKNSVILHDKSKLNYVSDEFKQTVEQLRRPDVAIYYQDKNGKPMDTATAFPFSRAKDDLERVVAGLKKSAKELDLPDMDAVLDKLSDRSWARNQEIRKEIKADKTAAKEAKSVDKSEPVKKSQKR